MNKNKIFEKIAKSVLRIETLERRNSDSLNFQEVSVWNLEKALDFAYRAGRDEELHIGKIVKNDGHSLVKLLGGTDLQHTGNYVFTLNIDGKTYRVVTEPTDEQETKIEILNYFEA